MAKIGLVTVLFNSNSVLEGFFKSLSNQTFKDYHLYIIDNTPDWSTDEIIASLYKNYPINSYTHIKNPGNYGVAKGNNQGIELSLISDTTHTLLLNNDIEFDQPDLLQQMYDCAIRHHETLIIPKILYYGTGKIWMAGGSIIHSKGIINHVGEGEDDTPVYNKPGYFTYAPTCFMLIDNKVFNQIGVMDENYFVYYDDTDFIYRAIKAGNKIYYMPGLNVIHKVSSSTGGGESVFSLYYSNRNRIYFIRKNYTGLKFILPITFTLITRVFKYLQYNSEKRESLLKAVFDGLKMR